MADITATIAIDFRGEQVIICYEGFPKTPSGMDGLCFWFQDERPWPDDLKDEEFVAICDAIEKHANAELDVRLERWRSERAGKAAGIAQDASERVGTD
jgi:hypothetical protein